MTALNQDTTARSMYYVYVLFDPRNNKPFYVGKGKGKRVEAHYYNWYSNDMCNPHKTRKIKKLQKLGYKPKWKIVFESNNINLVYEEEKKLISKWGRYRYDKEGILTNIRLGGEGSPESCRPVKQYNLFGEYIQEFSSCLEAAKSCGKQNSSAIVACCKKKNIQKSAHGFFWTYKDETLDLKWCYGRKRPVYQWSLTGEFIARYSNASQACKAIVGSGNGSGDVCKSARNSNVTAHGFRWTFDYLSPGPYIPKNKAQQNVLIKNGIFVHQP